MKVSTNASWFSMTSWGVIDASDTSMISCASNGTDTKTANESPDSVSVQWLASYSNENPSRAFCHRVSETSGGESLTGVAVGCGLGVAVWPGASVVDGVAGAVGPADGRTVVGRGETCETGGRDGCGAQRSPVGHGGTGGAGWLNKMTIAAMNPRPIIAPMKMATMAIGLIRDGGCCGLKYPGGGCCGLKYPGGGGAWGG